MAGDDNSTAKWAVIISMVAGVVTVLAFFGVRDVGDVGHLFGSGPATTATAPTYSFTEPNLVQPIVTTTDTTDTVDTSTETTTEPPATTPGPNTWDSYRTDQTPLTAQALLPSTFTDSENATFTLAASGPKPCNQAGSSDLVATVVAHGCTQMMTGVYLEQAGPNPPVLVSMEIFPFPDAATAQGMVGYFQGPARWSLTTWCTGSGAGAGPCGAGPGQHGYRNEDNLADHRYLITALVMRTDLSADPALDPWLRSAAVQAVLSSGPGK